MHYSTAGSIVCLAQLGFMQLCRQRKACGRKSLACRDCMNEQYLLRNKCGMFHKWKKITSASRHRPNPLEHILSQSKFNAGLAWAEWMIEGYSFSYWNTAHVGTSSGDEDNNANIRCCVCRHVEQSVQNKLLWGRHYYLWIWIKFI